jgi:drug/metabolite transporter (DMT)-like permease
MKRLALLLIAVNPVLWASFYATGRMSLEHVDPFLFSAAELSFAALPALPILWVTRRQITRDVIRRAAMLAGVLYLGLFTSTWALAFTTASHTAFYPALNGVIAALIAWAVYRSAIDGMTWLAGALAAAGAGLLILTSAADGGHWIGEAIALAAAVVYTGYIFLTDRLTTGEDALLWPMFATELVILVLIAVPVALLFGSFGPQDVAGVGKIWPALIFAGVMTTFLPTAISLFFQRFVDPVTVAFLYILEPVWGALIAHAFLGERLSMAGMAGGGLILLAALLKTWRSSRANS